MGRAAWLGVVAVLAAGCTDDDPAFRRLARGDRVELVVEGEHPPALKTLGPPPERAIRYVHPAPGTIASVEADDDESHLAEPIGAEPGVAKVDFRQVAVRLLEGEDEGTVGLIQRYHLRPEPR